MLFTTPVHSLRPWPGAEDLCEQRPGTATPAAGARTAVAWPRPRAPPRRDRPAPRRRRGAGRAPAAASSPRRPAPARRSWRWGAPPDRRAPRAGSAVAVPPAALRARQMQPPAAPRLFSINQTHTPSAWPTHHLPDTALYRPDPTRLKMRPLKSACEAGGRASIRWLLVRSCIRPSSRPRSSPVRRSPCAALGSASAAVPAPAASTRGISASSAALRAPGACVRSQTLPSPAKPCHGCQTSG